MDFLNELQEIPSDQDVQKLNLYEVINFIIDSDQDNKIKLLNLLVSELDLISVSGFKKTSTKSYNGIKNYCSTLKIAGKTFVIRN